MENILKNRLNLFYLLAAILLLGIIMTVAFITLFSKPTPSTLPTPTPTAPSPTMLPSPALREAISPSKQGVFTVAFAVAPSPTNFTITLAASSISNPAAPFTSVPFTSTFKNEGKLLEITTTKPVQDNTIYTLYVRLKSNNHIVVKHRYESQNGKLTIIDRN
ncbi:MAG: hypothetical protein Q8Q49_00265 [bacterium]|nr:hypothetical protein [bacterium]